MLESQTDILEKIILFLNFYTITTVIPFGFQFLQEVFFQGVKYQNGLMYHLVMVLMG